MTSARHFTIGQLVTKLKEHYPDLSVSKIRYFEDRGLLKPGRNSAGYRLFSQDDYDRAEKILYLQKTKFLPLSIIKDLLDQTGSKPQAKPQVQAQLELEGLEKNAGQSPRPASRYAGFVSRHMDSPALDDARDKASSEPPFSSSFTEKSASQEAKFGSRASGGEVFSSREESKNSPFRGVSEGPAGSGGGLSEGKTGSPQLGEQASGSTLGLDLGSGSGSALDLASSSSLGSGSSSALSLDRNLSSSAAPLFEIFPDLLISEEDIERLHPLDRMPQTLGVNVSFVRQLSEAGLIKLKKSPRGRALVDGRDFFLIRLAYHLSHFGFSARILRAYLVIARRETSFYEQSLAPYKARSQGLTREEKEKLKQDFAQLVLLTGAVREILLARLFKTSFPCLGKNSESLKDLGE